MSAAAVLLKAVQDKYAGFGLTPAELWDDSVPARKGASGDTTPPTAAAWAKAEPTATDYYGGLSPRETVRITLTGHFLDKPAASAWQLAVQYGGAPRASRAGLDDATGLTLPAGWEFDLCTRPDPGSVTRTAERGATGLPAYKAVLVYLVSAFRP